LGTATDISTRWYCNDNKPNSRNYANAAVRLAMAWSSVAQCRLPWCRSVRIRHYYTSALVPKCLGSEVSWVRSVLTPNHIRVEASMRCDAKKPRRDTVVHSIYQQPALIIFTILFRFICTTNNNNVDTLHSYTSLWSIGHL